MLRLVFIQLLGTLIFFPSNSNAAKAKNKIVLAWEAEPRTFDARFPTDAKSHYLSDLINCALITFDKDGKAAGSLATSWQWLNPRQISFKLRKGIKFSDGSIVTAADVKATYDFFKIQNLKQPSPLAGAYKTIDKVETPSKEEAVFTLVEPDVSFLQNFMLGILPQKIASQEMISQPENLIGCGPYRITSRSVNSIHLSPQTQYNLAPAPLNAGIEIKIVKDEMTRFSKLEKGEVDLVQDGLNREKVTQIAKKYPKLKVQKRPALTTAYLGFNMRDPILKKVEVRRAIALAINREEIINYILSNLAQPAVSLLMPKDPFLNPKLTQIKQDQKAAISLLEKNGFKGNPRFTLTYKTTTDATRISIAKAIAGQLQKVGIKVNVQAQEWGKFKADVEKGQVQMWSLSWVGFKDPDIYRYAFASESFPPQGANRGWYANKELDKLLATARVTTNTEERKKLYYEAQHIIEKDLPYIFLWHEESFAVMQKNIEGFEIYADGRMSSLVSTIKK